MGTQPTTTAAMVPATMATTPVRRIHTTTTIMITPMPLPQPKLQPATTASAPRMSMSSLMRLYLYWLSQV
jgi:hypothetical protein